MLSRRRIISVRRQGIVVILSSVCEVPFETNSRAVYTVPLNVTVTVILCHCLVPLDLTVIKKKKRNFFQTFRRTPKKGKG
jgi:hypothetical protein